MDLQKRFKVFFEACVFLAKCKGGKYEDEEIRVDLTGTWGVEIMKRKNNNPVVYAKTTDISTLFRQHGEWTEVEAHVLLMMISRLQAHYLSV